MKMNDTQGKKRDSDNTCTGTKITDDDLKNEDNLVTNNQPKKNIGKILSFVN